MQQPSQANQACAKPGGRILVVEDEIYLAVQVEECLKEEGYDVIDVVHSAEDAVTVAVDDRPDLIFMDIRLAADSDGIAAALEILKRTGIRSIFATAHADAETRARGEPAQPLGWLEKPFGIAAIVKAVNNGFREIEKG